jgi:hypothetical protein
MKKRIFLLSCSILLALTLTSLLSWSQAGKQAREFYQLTVYHYSNEEQEKILDNYLQNALLPALHRMSITKVGIFKALANDTSASKLLYVFLPMKSLDMVAKLATELSDDRFFNLQALNISMPRTRYHLIPGWKLFYYRLFR